jgi:ADP-heptose:LPS heptosyltransferase
LTSTDASALARNYPYIDHVSCFPIRELRKSKKHILDIIKLVWKLRKTKFDLIVNLFRVDSRAGALKMGLLFAMLRSKEKVGHDYKGFGRFLTKQVPWDNFQNRHFVEAMLDVAITAGAVPDDKGIEVFWDLGCEKKWSYLFPEGKHSNHQLTVGLNPGGDWVTKRWDPAKFAKLADHMIENYDAKVVLLGGPADKSIASKIESETDHSLVNLSGKLDLKDLSFIISRLDLLVTNDSGPMHIGAATKIPIVAIFGPGNPWTHGPYGPPELNHVIYTTLACQPCERSLCESMECIQKVLLEDVIIGCSEILRGRNTVFPKSIKDYALLNRA